MQGPVLNIAYNNGPRIQILKENTNSAHFQDNQNAFILQIHALNIAGQAEFLPAILHIINTIVGDQQPARDDLVAFANEVMENSYQEQRDQIEIGDQDENPGCAEGTCNGHHDDDDVCQA